MASGKRRCATFLEEEVAKLERRIKKIEQNPNPIHLKANKLRYQLEMEDCLDILEAWKAGKPFACMVELQALAHALGFVPLDYYYYGDRVADPGKYYNIVVTRAGYPQHTCDRTVTGLGLLLNGDLPKPSLIVAHRFACDPDRLSHMACADFSGCLFYGLDKPIGIHDDSLRYMAAQLEEIIQLAERSVPGIKYNEAKLIELLHIDNEAVDLIRRVYELRKKVPCPLSPKDAFRLALPPSWFCNPAKVLEYYRAYTNELFERAERGISGSQGEEKLRIAWLATGPYSGKTFDLLAEKGVSIPWYHYGMSARNFGVVHDDYFEKGLYDRELSPLEEMARYPNFNGWGDLADKWIDPLIPICRDLKIDAVVDFLQVGCAVTKGLRQMTAERVRKELGIPVLDLEGRQFFNTPAERAEMDRKLGVFLDMCILNKRTG